MKRTLTALALVASATACTTTGGQGPGQWKAMVVSDKINTNIQHVWAHNSNYTDWPYADIDFITLGCSSNVAFHFNIVTHNFLNDGGSVRYELRVDGYQPIKGSARANTDSINIYGSKGKKIAKQLASVPQGSEIHIRVYAWDGEISSDSLHAYDANGAIALTMERCGVK